MAYIEADRLSVHYPLIGNGAFSGASSPKTLTRIGSKRYILALDALTFSIEEGQRVGIVGRNGSGKSTLLRVMGKIFTPTGGALVTSGDISALFNLNLGTQADATGRENILLRGLVKGFSRQEIREHMDEIVEFCELEDFIDFPIRTYSDGMRMRLLFAIATSFSPEILLLDEWIGAGDSNFQEKASKRMTSLVDQAGITVIASHNSNLVKKVCDTGMWLDQGVMRAFGPIDDVFSEMDAYYRRN